MLTPITNIMIGMMVFRGCNEFKVSRSVDDLSSIGSITLPRLAIYDNKQRNIIAVPTAIKANDPVVIEVGYLEADLSICFKGYVKSINTGIRVVIEIEDAMYLLRQIPIVVTKNKVTLKALLVELLKNTGVTLADRSANMMIDEFQYKGNVAGAIAKLKEVLKLTIYINENNELYAGGESMDMLPKTDQKEATINLTYGVNIISNNVEFQTAESRPTKIVVKGKAKSGQETVATAGLNGGDVQTYMRYNVTDKKTLQKIADEYYAQQSYDGFRGSLTLFGLPRATAGGTVIYRNENYKEVEGRYFVKGVEMTLSTVGLRQVVTLGYKI